MADRPSKVSPLQKQAQSHELFAAWLLIGGLVLVLAGEPWGLGAVIFAVLFDGAARTKS